VGTESFEEVVVARQPALQRMLRRLGLSHQDAEDQAQEAVVLALTKGRSIEAAKIGGWLRGVARGLASNLRKRRESRGTATEFPSFRKAFGGTRDLTDEERERARLFHEKIDPALEALEPDEREVFELEADGDKTQEEIAVELGMSLDVVKKRLASARKKLCLALGGGGVELVRKQKPAS
jgi:RNA polymerase sigma factor (sigma-70 family)